MKHWLLTLFHCLRWFHRRAAYIDWKEMRIKTWCWDCFIRGQGEYAAATDDRPRPPFGLMYEDGLTRRFRDIRKRRSR